MRDAVTAVTNAVHRYAELLDEGDFEGVGDLLAGAAITSEGFDLVTSGRDDIVAFYTGATRRHDDGTPRTKHVTTNLIIEIDEVAGAATCRSYFTVLQAVPGALALQPIIAGRYRDRFARVAGEWRFAARHIVVDLVGDLSQHLLIDLGDA